MLVLDCQSQSCPAQVISDLNVEIFDILQDGRHSGTVAIFTGVNESFVYIGLCEIG